MNDSQLTEVLDASSAAKDVLLHNAQGPFEGLPRTACWGYPEPYTRDLMIASLGIATSGDKTLLDALRRTLESLAKNQTIRGHIPSLAHASDSRGASDTTPLFLLGVAVYRDATGESDFLADPVARAQCWMRYQSPEDLVLVAQQPTTDWRDEQWVLGYGLYVNTLVYAFQRLHNQHAEADAQWKAFNGPDASAPRGGDVHEGLRLSDKPYFAFWAHKVDRSDRFDLLGNSLAILTGLASPSQADAIIDWVETECEQMRRRGELSLHLPPCFFPYCRPGDDDWRDRYEHYNLPGEYHNGGIWPFVCGFYIAALVAAGRFELADRALLELTGVVRRVREHDVTHGFNEWFCASDGELRGQDWQTWSASMYLYAAACVRGRTTPVFDTVRRRSPGWESEK